MAEERYFQAGEGRVFIQKSPGPTEPLQMLGCGKLGGVTIPQGDKTPIYCPDPTQYDKFRKVAQIRGQADNPTSQLAARLTMVNLLLTIKCAMDVQARFGKCKDPNDLKNGWEKIFLLSNAEATSKATEDLIAVQPDERKAIMVTADITADEFLEIDRISFTQYAQSLVDREVIDIVVCDRESCGDCEPVSDGCEKVYAIVISSGGSPGIWAELVWTEDGGVTWSDTPIDTLAVNESPDAIVCVGDYLIVISNDSCSIHYADKDDEGTWSEVTTGFVATKCPNAIFSLDAAHTWIVGDGGYVYFTEDPTVSVEVQDAGVATTQNLNAVHFLNSQRGVAVGASNAVIVTDNGGLTWESKTGPAVGVALNAVWVDAQNRFWVGTAGGRLYYTEDGGTSWTEKTFPGSAAGVVRDIKFVSPGHAVGFMAHDTATPAGRILRTLDHGYSWYVLPEGTGSIPANDRINQVAICDQNRIWGAGLADDASDGIIVKGD